MLLVSAWAGAAAAQGAPIRADSTKIAQGFVRADSIVVPAMTPARADSAAMRDSTIGPPIPAAIGNPAAPAARSAPPSRFEFVTTAPDSSEAEAERVLSEAAARRRARVRSPIVLKRFEAPRWVMLRSALLPGWGQIHNRAWLKAIGIGGGEIAFAAQIWRDERELNRLSRLADEAQAANDEVAFGARINAYNARLAAETNRRWLLGGLLAYALVDAYVDAHFANFKAEFDVPPPASDGTSGGARLRVGWSF